MANKNTKKTGSSKKSKSTSKQANDGRVKPVKKSNSSSSQKRQKAKLDVRNEHARKKKAKRKKKVVINKPQKKSKDPIYDELKYQKRLRRTGRKGMKFILLFYLIIYMITLVFVVKIELTHTRNGNNLNDFADNQYTKTVNVDSQRGTIYDKNGDALAINLTVYDMVAITDNDYQCIKEGETTYTNCSLKASKVDPVEAGAKITEALGGGNDMRDYLTERIKYGLDNGKYQVSFGKYGQKITLSQKNALDKLGYNWLQFTPQKLRFYPYGDFASYVVGYTTTDENGDINGELGVEKALDGHLRGQDGKVIASYDKNGIELTDKQKSVLQKVDGTDVYLTLDSTIQTYLESSMEKALSKDKVKDVKDEGLFTIVMDAKTGDILAAQSYPSFDPNERNIENYTNFFTNYCFEPGSTFKTATIAAAYESGIWDDESTYPTGTRHKAEWGGYPISDYETSGWGNLSWREGYYMSSNTVMTHIMDKMDKTYWTDFVTDSLEIGQPVKTQFFETPSCDFSPQYDVDYATTSFGQGMTVNVLQLLRMYSALVEDGTMVTPHIVDKIKDSDTGETIYSDKSLEKKTGVVTKETSKFVRDMMRGVVTYDRGDIQGTGENYKGSEYDIGMKTGTSQVAGDNGKYIKDRYIYSTMAAAPIDDPQLLIYTAVIKPDDYWISWQAMPEYVKEVFDNSISYLNSENRKVDIDNKTEATVAKSYVGKDTSDMKDNVITVGTGKIKSQYPKSGQKLEKSQHVVVFGSKNLKMPDITGYSYNETVAICNGLDVDCQFKKSGTAVKSYEAISKNKYKITMG